MNNIPVTLFRDLPVYTGSIPADGIQVVAVENNTNTYRVPLESLTGSMAEVAPRKPESPDDDVRGDLAWDDGELYVNTPSGWQKSALYSYGNWEDIVPGTRFLRVDDTMSLSAAEVQNALESLGIDAADSTHRGVVYVASSLDDAGSKVATVQLVKDCVDGVAGRMEELYVDMQDMVEHVDGVKVSVDGSLELALAAKGDVDNAKAYVTAAEARIATLDTRVALNADNAELAAQRAEAAAAEFPGFDSVPVTGSVKAVRSGGIKEWGDASFLPLSHASDIEEGDYTIHVSAEDRDRWDSASSSGLDPDEREALDNLVQGDIIGGNVRIGVDVGETVLWIRKSSDGTNDVSVTADGVTVVASGGLVLSGQATIDGGVSVSGLVTAGGNAVLTVADAGSFPASGGEAEEGYATVLDAMAYIDSVRDDIFEKVAERYVPAVTTDFATIGGDNTFTGTNRFTMHPVYAESMVVSSGIELQAAGAAGPSISMNAATGELEASILSLAGNATIDGSLAVDGEATFGSALTVGGYTVLSDGLEVAEDLNLGGTAIVSGNLFTRGGLEVSGDTSLLGGLDISGVTVFRDRIESDVEIGYGPLGNVQAEALLEIGDPKAAGYMDYNGYRLVLGAGERTAAHGQLKLLDGYQTCIIAIGDETRSVSPVPRDTAVQSVYAAPAAAQLMSDSTPVSNDAEGTCAAVRIGPSTLRTGSVGTNASLIGCYRPISILYDGEAVYRFPSIYKWTIGSANYGTKSLCNIYAGLDKSNPVDGVTSPAMQYLFGASMHVAPAIPEGETVPYFKDVEVDITARQAGAAAHMFSISADGTYGGDNPSTWTASINARALSGGSGTQEAVCAVGVLKVKDSDTGQYRLPVVNDILVLGGTPYLRFNGQGYIKVYKDQELIAELKDFTYNTQKSFSELCSLIPSITTPALPIDFYTVKEATTGSYDVYTLHCKARDAGAEGNGYRIEIYTGGNQIPSDTYAVYLKIEMFGGVDGVDPGSDTVGPVPPGPTPPAYGTAYGDIGPSVNGTGQYGLGVGISWYGEGGPGVNPVYLMPHANSGPLPTINDFDRLSSDDPPPYTSPAFKYRLTSEYVAGDLSDHESLVYRVASRHKGAVDNGFAATARDSDTTSTPPKSLTTQLTGGLETEQEAVCAIGVLRNARDSLNYKLFVLSPEELDYRFCPAGTRITLYDNTSTEMSSIVLDNDATMQETAGILNGMQSLFDVYMVRTYDGQYGGDAYTLHCKAKEAGSTYNGYRLYISTNTGVITSNIYDILMFAGADAYDPGSDTGSDTVPPGPTPEYDPVTPQQVATLVSTIPGYTGAVNALDANVVDVTATQTGTVGNKPMESYGGLAVKAPLDGGKDDRTVADLVEAINGTDIFDLTAHVQNADVIRLTANQSGEEPNDRPVTTSGCFGFDGTVMGSSRRGADGIPGSTYKLWLNGEQVFPGGGGGGEPFDGHLEADLHVGHEGTAFKIYLNGEEFKGDSVPASYRDRFSTTGSNQGTFGDQTVIRLGAYWAGRLVGNKIWEVRLKGRSDRPIQESRMLLSDQFHFTNIMATSEPYTMDGDYYVWKFAGEVITGLYGDDDRLYMGLVPASGGTDRIQRGIHGSSYSSRVTGDTTQMYYITPEGQGAAISQTPVMEIEYEAGIDSSLHGNGRPGLAAGPAWGAYTTPISSGGVYDATYVKTDGGVNKYAGPELAAHEGDASAHLDSFERELVNNLGAGWLWYPNRTGSVTVMPDTSGNPNGIAIQSTNAYGRIEIQDYGVVITATRRPQWLEASLEAYAFHDILTTKDVDPASIPAVAARVTTLESTTVPAVANRVTTLESTVPNKQDIVKDSMREIVCKGPAGTEQFRVYYGDTKTDFLYMTINSGIPVNGVTYRMITKWLFDKLGTKSGGRVTMQVDGQGYIFYEPTATGGNAIFSIQGVNNVTGGIAPDWSTYVPQGSITVGPYQPVTRETPSIDKWLAAKEADTEFKDSLYAAARTRNKHVIEFKDSSGTLQVKAFYGDTMANFAGVLFPNGITKGGVVYKALLKDEFDALAATDGTIRRFTSDSGEQVFYDPAATGGNAVFRVHTTYNNVRGGVNPQWGTAAEIGTITVARTVCSPEAVNNEASSLYGMISVLQAKIDDLMSRLS